MAGVYTITNLRILQITKGLAIGDQDGGAELVALQLARLLTKSDISSGVYSMWFHKSNSQEKWLRILSDENIPVFGMCNFSGNIIKDYWKQILNLIATIIKFKPNIINSHSERSDLINVIVNIIYKKRIRIVRTIHINKIFKTHPYLGLVFSDFVFPFFFDAEIAISKEIKKDLEKRKLSKNHKIFLCYNGVDAKLFNENNIAEYRKYPIKDLQKHRPLIGIVGRLTEQKGHRYLILAINKIPPCQRPHVIFVGSGDKLEPLRKLVSDLNLSQYIYFMGSRSDTIQIISQLTCLVSASLWEGFPTVILEAMSQKIPVIATNISGSNELVINNKTGYLIPPADIDCLSNSIISVLKNSSRSKEMADKAYILAKKYTIQNTAVCFEKVYRLIYS